MHRRFDSTGRYCLYHGGAQTDSAQGVPLTLGIASVPVQIWNENIFEGEQGLACGTIFPDLVLPFTGGRTL